MRYWEACEAQVTTGNVIAHPDEQAAYCGADILGYLGY